MSPALLVLLSWMPTQAAQTEAQDLTVAVVRGELEEAARQVALATNPAERARLLAALEPVPERAAAMLAVARAFAADPEADRALVAGAAAALAGAGAGRVEASPELAAWMEFEEFGDWDPQALAPVVLGLHEAVAARRVAGGDAQLLEEAERLLALASVSRFGLAPVHVPVDAPWERLREVREPLRLSLFPCEPGPLAWRDLDALGPATWSTTLSTPDVSRLAPLPAGDWLLEARSTITPWRGVRRVLVSDLQALALTQDGWIALAAFDRDGPATAQWELRRSAARVLRGELEARPALVHVEGLSAGGTDYGELRLRGARGTAWLGTRQLGTVQHDRERWLSHVMLDRPIFRPGETVFGRIVLRSCAWEGEGLASVPSSTTAADVNAVVVVTSDSLGERRLPARTDTFGHAPFSFVIPAEAAPDERFEFALELPEHDERGEPLRLPAGPLCSVANFRRQAVHVVIDAPATVTPELASVDVSVGVSWASGGPAANLDVKATVERDDAAERVQQLALQTDATGRATLRVPVANTSTHRVDVRFSVTGPDGKQLLESRRLTIEPPRGEAEALAPAAWLSRAVPELEFGSAVVGAPCPVRLRGRPGEQVLVVIGRSARARVQLVELDPQGLATIDERVLRSDWPRFDVAAATVAGTVTDSVPVRLKEVQALELELPASAEPGQDTTLRALRAAPGALVTFAVVDERIFELAEDRTVDPESALRPSLPNWTWSRFHTPVTTTPAALLESLLSCGRLPQLDWTRDLSETSISAAGSGGSPRPEAAVRSRFCPTANFATVIADEQGNATTTFRLPDDLTRWRVTAVAIAPDGSGGIVRSTFASGQPLTAEPLVPRGLRAGDEFELPISVDRSVRARGSDAVRLRSAMLGDALVVDREQVELDVEAGRAVTTSVPVRAVAAGETTLRLDVELGAFADRSERTLVVGADRVARRLTAVASGVGEVAVQVPEGASPDATVELDVLQGGADAWRLLEADLASYPYGCAEQTLARLLPRLALLKAAKAHGEPAPVIDPEFAKRLRAGLAHLRTLQPDSSGEFAFWPGEPPNVGISALVHHGLAVLRDAGFDLDETGLALPRRSRPSPLLQSTEGHEVDAEFVLAAERLAGLLRLDPRDDSARSQLQSAVANVSGLPAGLCARMGLALSAAGDRAGALECQRRLQDVLLPNLAPDGFPGEDPLAVQALRLELELALGATALDAQRATADLLLACLAGEGSTYGRACALAVLASVLPRTEPTPGQVTVEFDGERREFTLPGAAGTAVRCRLPRTSVVTVRGPAGMPLLVRLTTERSERASDHPEWAAPIHVERSWCTSNPAATEEERRNGADLLPVIAPIAVGRPLVLRIVVTAPVAMRHVVVACALPAGFELPNEPGDVERLDDAVALTCDLEAGVPRVLRLTVVPTTVGRFLWPPTVAMPMYCAESDGGTAGGWVEVVAAPEGFGRSFAELLPIEAAFEPEEAPFPLEAWLEVFRDAFEEDREPTSEALAEWLGRAGEEWTWGEYGPQEESRAQLVTLLWRKLPDWDADPSRALEAFTDLLWRIEESATDPSWPERAWRGEALDRLRALTLELATEALRSASSTTDEHECERLEQIAFALEQCKAGAQREATIARWWRAARDCEFAASTLLDLVPTAPEVPELRAAVSELALRVDGWEFQRTWELLDDDSRAALPPQLVLDRAESDSTGILTFLAGRDTGRSALERRLLSAEFVLSHFDALERELPIELWRKVPLHAFEGLALVALEHSFGPEVESVLACLSHAAFPVPDLQQALASARVPAWRYVLACTLRARGARGADGLDHVAGSSVWTRALALDAQDATEAIALLEDARRLRPGPDLSGELALLASFTLPAIVARGTPRQLLAERAAFENEDWHQAWQRLSSAERLLLLEQLEDGSSPKFVPGNATEAEALWKLLQRSEDFDALEALLSSPVGIDCVCQHLRAPPLDPLALEVRERYARLFGLAEDTLTPPPGRESFALLARLFHVGPEASRRSLDLDLLRRLRLIRGL